jgi:hypothetical protein
MILILKLIEFLNLKPCLRLSLRFYTWNVLYDSELTVFLCLQLFGAGKSRARQPKKLRRKLPRAGNKPTPMMQQTRATAQPKRGSRGRVKKAKPKKTIKINGLDLLHSQTLLSTSPQGELQPTYTPDCLHHVTCSISIFLHWLPDLQVWDFRMLVILSRI